MVTHQFEYIPVFLFTFKAILIEDVIVAGSIMMLYLFIFCDLARTLQSQCKCRAVVKLIKVILLSVEMRMGTETEFRMSSYVI